VKTKGVCCSCGHEVAANNNTLFLELTVEKILRHGLDYTEDQVTEKAAYYVALEFRPWRHLLPVIEGGKLVCQGTPSSAQYLDENLPKLSSYDAENKERYCNAYQRMLDWATAIMAAEDKNAPHA